MPWSVFLFKDFWGVVGEGEPWEPEGPTTQTQKKDLPDKKVDLLSIGLIVQELYVIRCLCFSQFYSRAIKSAVFAEIRAILAFIGVKRRVVF